jgi:hypothetical protein
VIASLLSACSTAPITQKEPVQGLLKNNSDVCMQMQKNPAITGARFDVTGYTIFGVVYVAAAVSKMKEQSTAMNVFYADYLKNHPDVLPLQITFNNELRKDLLAHGINIKDVSTVAKISADKKLSYSATTSEPNIKDTIVIDGLTSLYFAPSSTDSYNPQSMVLVSDVENNAGFIEPRKQDQVVVKSLGDSGLYSFKDFNSIQSNPEHSYAGLQKSVIALADKVADSLINKASQ